MEAMNKKTVYGILNDADGFSVSDNYTWTVAKCKTFWKNLSDFAFSNSEGNEQELLDKKCLLGSIMSVAGEEENQLISGQDNFITIMLILKALRENLRFYEQHIDEELKDLCFTIDRLIHGLNNCGLIDKNNLRIVVQDKNQESDFSKILLAGQVAEDSKSAYAENYRFFFDKIFRLTVAQCRSLAEIILYACSFLHIEVDSREDGENILKMINNMDSPIG